jgi:PPOX class probable F420-dependent enzyme
MNKPVMRTLVEKARVGHLATVSAEGRPHIVPVCFALLGEVIYSAVDHKPKRGLRLQRMINIQATGYASLLVDAYHEDWSKLWWVRLDGPARMVLEPDEAATAVMALVNKYRQYALQVPAGPVLAIDTQQWRGWSATQDLSGQVNPLE